MADNEFLPFGTGAGANVLPQVDWAALADRSNGFQSGKAKSLHVNKALRQAAFVAAMIGQFTADYGGDALDNGDLPTFEDNFKAAIRSQRLNYVVAGGTANALTVTLDPAGPVPVGTPLRVIAAARNTGPVTLNDGGGVLPVTNMRGDALAWGDIQPGQPLHILRQATSWRYLGIAYSELRTRLRADTTFFVRGDGNDLNSGLGNTAAEAFKTLAGAWAAISTSYDTAGYTITIKLGVAGTYDGASLGYFAGTVRILGGDTPAEANDYIIRCATDQPYVIQSRVQGLYLVNAILDYTFTSAVQPVEAIVWAAPGGAVYCDGVRYRNTAARTNLHLNYIEFSAAVRLLGGVYLLSTAAFATFVYASGGGVFVGAVGSSATTITIAGTLSVAIAFMIVTTGATADFYNVNFSGAFATGKRFQVDKGGGINTSGGGVNYLPGSTAGTTDTATGGWYA